jgi:hypothetical protein
MSTPMFDRVAASGGAAFTLLAFSTLVVVPPAPDVSAPAAEIRSYLVDAHERFGFSVVLMALAVLALCLVLGHVSRQVGLSSGGTSMSGAILIAGAATVSMALAGVLLQGVLAQQSAGVDDSTLRALYRSWQVVAFIGPPLPLAVVLSVAFISTLRDAILPRWTGWLALIAAIGGVGTALLNLGTDVTAPVTLDLGSFLLTCVWLTAVTVSAFVGQPAREPARVTGAT